MNVSTHPEQPQGVWRKSWYAIPVIIGLLLAPTPYLFATVAVVPIPDSLSTHTKVQADGTKTGPLPAGLDKFLKNKFRRILED